MRHLNSVILLLCGLLLVPAFAFAQESAESADNSSDVVYQPRIVETAEATETADAAAVQNEERSFRAPRTAKDNFGGLRLGADLMFGVGRCDDKLCIGQPEDDWDQENIHFSTSLQLGVGYLWGNDAFVGPELNVHGGYPFLIGGDVRVRLVLPVNYNNAFTMSAGWGLVWRMKILDKFGHYIPVDEDSSPDDDRMADIIRNMYIPVQVGFEHVFDNGFVLGVTLEARMTFNSETNVLGVRRRLFDSADSIQYSHMAEEEHAHLTFGMAGAGVHLGYAF